MEQKQIMLADEILLEDSPGEQIPCSKTYRLFQDNKKQTGAKE